VKIWNKGEKNLERQGEEKILEGKGQPKKKNPKPKLFL